MPLRTVKKFVPTRPKGIVVEIVSTPPDLACATIIASSGFMQPVSTELEADVEDHLGGGDIVYGLKENGEYVGFVIFSIWEEILYLSGIMVEAGHQRRSNLTGAVDLVRQQADVKYLALRTQSPRMWSAARKLCSLWLPDQNATESPEELLSVARVVTDKTGSPFPTHVGCYGNPLYGEKPCHHNQSLQDWWDGLCNFERGDAVICVGILT